MYPLPCRRHDHQHCVQTALRRAREICQQRGLRLTTKREQVLKLVWQSHRPLGAYALMDMLATATTRQIAPPTVYRALDFLCEQGLIHKIHSLNAFVGCPSPGRPHAGHFLICRTCRVAVEQRTHEVERALAASARAAGFARQEESIEILGLCPACRETQQP